MLPRTTLHNTPADPNLLLPLLLLLTIYIVYRQRGLMHYSTAASWKRVSLLHNERACSALALGIERAGYVSPVSARLPTFNCIQRASIQGFSLIVASSPGIWIVLILSGLSASKLLTLMFVSTSSWVFYSTVVKSDLIIIIWKAHSLKYM